mgnify:FL=1
MADEPKPCPFDGAHPVDHVEGFVFCEAEGCPLAMRLVPIAAWNRRTGGQP